MPACEPCSRGANGLGRSRGHVGWWVNAVAMAARGSPVTHILVRGDE
jgi:hypothetical protein